MERARPLRAALGNEEGMALVVSMLLLLALTAMGSAAIMATSVESKIAGSDLVLKQAFYSADASATQAMEWLGDRGSAPSTTSGSTNAVKAYGDGQSSNDKGGVDYDGVLGSTNYRYTIDYSRHGLVAGSSAQYRQFFYDATAEAAVSGNAKSSVKTTMSKVFRVDY